MPSKDGSHSTISAMRIIPALRDGSSQRSSKSGSMPQGPSRRNSVAAEEARIDQNNR